MKIQFSSTTKRKISLYLSYLCVFRRMLSIYFVPVAVVSALYLCFVASTPSLYMLYFHNIIQQRSISSAKDLSISLFGANFSATNLLSETLMQSIRDLVVSGSVIKLKIYELNGFCIFSTTESEIGKIHKDLSLFEIFSLRGSYSSIVRKTHYSLENEIVQIDVSETYVPLFSNGTPKYVFEVYSDVTREQRDLNFMMFFLYCLSLTIIACSALFIFYISLHIVKNERARHKIQKIILRRNKSQLDCIISQIDEINIGYKMAFESLASLAEYNDSNTGEHLNRIRNYVSILSKHLATKGIFCLSEDGKVISAEDLGLAALLHDIGKIVVPNSILRKCGQLTPNEFDVVKLHAVVAGDILERANAICYERFNKDSYLKLARDIALYHHERWDGSGYPFGLSGKSIPLSARIVAVADVYDALRSDRPYKVGWTHQDAVFEIFRCRGTMFDPVVVDAFALVSDQFESLSNFRH